MIRILIAFIGCLAALAGSAYAQIGEAKSSITWGELSAAVGIAVTSAGVTVAIIMWIVNRTSKDKQNVHARIDELTKQTNDRFLAAIEQITAQSRMTEQKVHAIELVLAQRYVTKEDLHTEVSKILAAVERSFTDLRADVRTVHDRLNRYDVPTS